MAKTLTLRDVPEPVVRALRARARRNHRSMQKEILAVIEGVVIDRSALIERIAACRSHLEGSMSLDEIHEAIEEGRP